MLRNCVPSKKNSLFEEVKVLCGWIKDTEEKQMDLRNIYIVKSRTGSHVLNQKGKKKTTSNDDS
jgi:hypothetical protein